jgi:aryl-alcohol dehydrogenase-like predicted oxidoreductase
MAPCCADETAKTRFIGPRGQLYCGATDQVLVATKGGLNRPRGNWVTNGPPEHLKAACNRSLKALGTDCIALYQLHAPDDDVPFADSVDALAELKQRGKIQHIGLSNVQMAEIELAQSIVPITSVQNRFNWWEPLALDDGVLDHCIAQQIAFIPHSPVGGFRGHVRTQGNEILQPVAGRHGASTYQILLAWILSLSPIVIPIPGASRLQSVLSSAAAAALQLDEQTISQLKQTAGAG